MSFTVNKLDLKDFEMQYVRFGRGEKTLVILPGLSIQSVVFAAALIEKQYEIFSREFTVYLFDRRDNLPESYCVYDMAEDTAKAMKELGLDKTCLFGTSQGAMMALVIAANHSELVSRLVIGSAICKADDSIDIIEEWIEFAQKGKTEELCLSFGENVYPKDFFSQNRQAFISMAKTVTQDNLKRFLILAKGTRHFDASECLNKIQCPVLFISDTDDKVFGNNAGSDIFKKLKNNESAQLYMYSGYGHAVYDMAPDYTYRLYDFFTENIN
ncbi:MAG: alpha/beta hydrolase [Eubacterium sp.]|nr:alpha/beta hydrolase [Eubacterium sp.]